MRTLFEIVTIGPFWAFLFTGLATFGLSVCPGEPGGWERSATVATAFMVATAIIWLVVMGADTDALGPAVLSTGTGAVEY